jgi:hypothetical protein
MYKGLLHALFIFLLFFNTEISAKTSEELSALISKQMEEVLEISPSKVIKTLLPFRSQIENEKLELQYEYYYILHYAHSYIDEIDKAEDYAQKILAMPSRIHFEKSGFYPFVLNLAIVRSSALNNEGLLALEALLSSHLEQKNSPTVRLHKLLVEHQRKSDNGDIIEGLAALLKAEKLLTKAETEMREKEIYEATEESIHVALAVTYAPFDPARAIVNFKKLIAKNEAVESNAQAAINHENVATLYLRIKDYVNAEKHAQFALDISTELQQTTGIAAANIIFARINTAYDELEKATRYLKQGELFLTRSPHPLIERKLIFAEAEHAVAKGNFRNAKALLLKHKDKFVAPPEAGKGGWLETNYRGLLAEAYAGLNEFDKAYEQNQLHYELYKYNNSQRHLYQLEALRFEMALNE